MFSSRKLEMSIIILAVHVNDGMATGSSITLINKFKKDLNVICKLTDMGAHQQKCILLECT